MKHVFGKKSGQSGFSLVELMIVVGIIGVLATLALPRFKQFQAKAKMAEAGNNLAHIYTLEQSYSLDNSTFINFTAPAGASLTAIGGCAPGTNAIGFVIEPCLTGLTAVTPRFQYNVLGSTSATFFANATTGAALNNRICPNNPQFNIQLTGTNEPRWAQAAAAGANAANVGQPNISTICGS